MQYFPSFRSIDEVIQLPQYEVMSRNQHSNKNQLVVYRRRMGYSQKQAAAILGHGSTSMLSRYETGRSWPPLLTALRLEILYRIPVAFLYSKIYRQIKDEVRRAEDQLAEKGQLKLF